MRWKAVSLDVAGTLIEPHPSVGHVYAEVASEHGFKGIDPERLNRQFQQAWGMRGAFDYSRRAWADVVAATFAGLADPLSAPGFFDALYNRFAERSAWRVYDDVPPFLRWAGEAGVVCAVVSNWDERLTPLLADLGLDGFFRVISVSGLVGVHKPAPEIFRVTLHRLGLEPESVLHVGDSRSEDYAGALAAGMEACLLRREAGSEEPGIRTVRDLGEVRRLFAA